MGGYKKIPAVVVAIPQTIKNISQETNYDATKRTPFPPSSIRHWSFYICMCYDSRHLYNSRWKFCASCESVTPPRSWHCNICNICILKREHHCMFVGYCVGHRNHRYFCLFLFYMWVSVIYCTYFNTSFLVPQLSEASWGQILKFIFPMVMLITGLDASWLQVYIFFWSVHFAALLLTTVLLAYHVNLIFRGRTTYENNNNISLYNLGWRQNLCEVFGKNWRKAILWPMAS